MDMWSLWMWTRPDQTGGCRVLLWDKKGPGTKEDLGGPRKRTPEPNEGSRGAGPTTLRPFKRRGQKREWSFRRWRMNCNQGWTRWRRQWKKTWEGRKKAKKEKPTGSKNGPRHDGKDDEKAEDWVTKSTRRWNGSIEGELHHQANGRLTASDQKAAPGKEGASRRKKSTSLNPMTLDHV